MATSDMWMPHDEHGSRVANAAGRAALVPARAVARAWRGPLEDAVEELLASPEVARVIDRVLAGPLPEELTQSLARNRVLERIVAELVDSGEFERMVAQALDSPRTLELTDSILSSDETQRAIRLIASSPELRAAIAQQTGGLAQEVTLSVRTRAVMVDDAVEHMARRPVRTEPPACAGLATRSIAFAIDTVVTLGLYMLVVGSTALVASLVGGLRPPWLVGVLLASGWILIAGTYVVFFWTTVGRTPGMRILGIRVARTDGRGMSVWRSIVRAIGLVLAIVPMFLGFLPVVFTQQRRGLADYLAGSIVTYDHPAMSHEQTGAST